jgi:heme exporter protein D
MKRWLMVLALMLPLTAQAQTDPQLSVDLPEGEVIVGQPLTLRIKLLVPTWMPKPPVWPTLEVPSLLVRLPERASTPVSETINGATWSGISRAYRLYPLELGRFEIPGQSLTVTYADPGKPDPIVAQISLEAIRFQAVLPKEAEGLDPPIVASGLTLEQQIDGGPDLETGGAVTRVVTISIEGTTPILLPSLMPELPATLPDPPLRAYPKEPVVRESEQRGVLSGSRVETTTYVAQFGGQVDLPAISLKWFNRESGKVETAKLGSVSLRITAPPPPPPGPADYARWVAYGAGVLAIIWMFIRLVWPRTAAVRKALMQQWRASERYAARAVQKALRGEKLAVLYPALDHWQGFFPLITDADRQALDKALANIGAAQFATSTPRTPSWQPARDAFSDLRRAQRRGLAHPEALPRLNP